MSLQEIPGYTAPRRAGDLPFYKNCVLAGNTGIHSTPQSWIPTFLQELCPCRKYRDTQHPAELDTYLFTRTVSLQEIPGYTAPRRIGSYLFTRTVSSQEISGDTAACRAGDLPFYKNLVRAGNIWRYRTPQSWRSTFLQELCPCRKYLEIQQPAELETTPLAYRKQHLLRVWRRDC